MIDATDFTSNNLVFSSKVDRLNFGQFDQGNVLYHANYLPICELGREKFLLSIGTSYGKLMKESVHLPIVHLEQKFIKPVLYEEDYSLNLHILELTKTKIKFGHQISRCSDSVLINLTVTKHTCVQSVDGVFKVCKIPENTFQLLQSKLKSTND